jgi:zinc protease
LAWAIAAGACSQASERGQPPAELKDSWTRSKLGNGLELVVVPRPSVPLVTVLVAFRSGAFVEEPEQSGYSHLLEHMMFKGSADVPDETEYRKRLRALGVSTNAFTAIDSVEYYGVMPRDNLDAGMALLAGALRAPLIDPAALNDEIQVVLAELDLDDSDPDRVQNRRLMELLFQRYPNRKNVIGKHDVIAGATPDDLRALYDRYYVPNNALLVLSGDLDKARGVALAHEYFGDWARARDPFEVDKVPEHPMLSRDTADVSRAARSDARLLVSWQGPDPRHDLAAMDAAGLLGQITIESSQSFRSVVGDGVIGGSMYFNDASHTGVFTAELTIASGAERSAIERLRTAVSQLPSSITQAQLETARDLIWADRLSTADASTSAAFQIAGDWTFAGLDYHERYLDSLYDVTRANVVDVLESYVIGHPKAAVLVSGSDTLNSSELRSLLEQPW